MNMMRSRLVIENQNAKANTGADLDEMVNNMKKQFLLLLPLLVITSCTDEKPVSVTQTTPPSSITATPTQKANVKFEVSSFTQTYSDSTVGSFFTEQYNGKAIITAAGAESLVKKPYTVMLQIKKVSGGSQRDDNSGTRLVIVYNGIGETSLNDWSSDKSAKMEKPNYEFKILGYTPYIEQ